MIQIKRILAPTDFSESSFAAAHYAMELADAFGAEVHLLHVIEPPVYYSPAFGGYIPDRADLQAYAAAGLEGVTLADEPTDVKIVRRWVEGQAASAIIEDVEKNNIDIVVLGTHGHSAVRRFFMGSVAERVVRHACCPVLTVRPATSTVGVEADEGSAEVTNHGDQAAASSTL